MKNKKTSIYSIGATLTLGAILFISAMFVVPAAGDSVDNNKNTQSDKKVVEGLEKVSTMANFKKVLKEINKDRIPSKNNDYSVDTDAMEDIAVPEMTMNKNPSTGSGMVVSEDYSQTNIQVQGVDEADIVKTDGRYIYYLGYKELFIVDGKDPKNLELVNTIDFNNNKETNESFSPREMFIDKTTLTVIGSSYGDFLYRNVDPEASASNDTTVQDTMMMPYRQVTTAIVYNIENPNNVTEVRSFDIEASYVSSRKIEDIIYMVTSNYIYNFENPIMPRAYDSLAKEAVSIDLDRTYIIPDGTDSALTNIISINTTNAEISPQVESFVGASGTIYSSRKNLYLTNTVYDYKPEANEVNTNIFRFALDKENVVFKAKGSVDGYALSQFSMDEFDNHFRIATTTSTFTEEGNKSINTFYVLDEHLKEVGKISGIAEGEEIKSVRFAGEKAYVVTFEQTDPLFVIDAKDHTNPQIMGELKIPGFSTYLHPYDENHLIGLGYDTEYIKDQDWVKQKGLKLSMFDVSDITNPIEMFTEIIGDEGSYSEALHNHKSFMFSKDKDLLVMPITIVKNESKVIAKNTYYGSLRFNGSVVYDVTLSGGFKQKMQVTHNDNKDSYEDINRSLYIDDTLFTLSKNIIKSTDLKTNTILNTLEIRKP